MQGQRIYIGIAVILALCAVAAWLLTQDEAAEVSRTDVADGNTPPEREVDAEGTRNERTVSTSRFSEGGEKSTVESEEVVVDPPDPNGILVRVIDAETKAPIPHAYVSMEVEDGGIGHRLRRMLITMRTTRDLSYRSGRTYRCDERGEVRIPWSSRRGGLTAWKGSRVHRKWRFPITDQAILIELGPGRWIDVIVRDPGGDPVANVPVGLREGEIGGPSFTMVRATTDTQGRARLDHLHLHAVPGPNWKSHVCIDMPLAEPIGEPVDVSALPTEPVELQMPASGSVVVTVGRDETERGKRLEVAVGPDPDKRVMNYPIPLPGVRVLPLPASGTVTFPHVGVGLDLSVEVWSDVTSTPVRKSFAGPQENGQTVEVAVTWEDLTPRFTGVAKLEDDTPITSTLLDFRIGDQWDATLTDSEGRFTLAFDPTGAADARKLVLRRYGSAPLRATVDLPEEMTPGIHDLGVVRLEALGLFAAGRIVDLDGAPIPCAAVRLQAGRGDDLDKLEWKTVSERTASDRDGRFGVTLKSPLSADSEPPEAYRLSVSAAGYAPATVPVTENARDVVVRLKTGASCSARLLVPDGVGRKHLDVKLMAKAAGRFVSRKRFERKGPNELVAVFADLSAGSYELRVHLRGTHALVSKIDDLDVPMTGTVTDPRISPIDLRSTLRATKITTKSSTGKTLTDTSLRLVRGKEQSSWLKNDAVDSELGLLYPVGWSVEVAHKGFIAARIPSPAPTEHVLLRDGMRIRIHVAGITLPKDHTLVGWIRDTGRYGSDRLTFDAGGTSEVVTVEAVGEHSIMLTLRTKVDGRHRFHRIRPRLTVNVADVGGLQDIVLNVDQSSVDAAAQHAP